MNKIPSKIKNLNYYKKFFNVPYYKYFSESFCLNRTDELFKNLKKEFKENKIIIRSAAFDEDRKISNAGRYLSLPNVIFKSVNQLRKLVTKVSKDYPKNSNNFIIFQKMINNSKNSGVIFTQNFKNGLPFSNINFMNSNKSDVITSGFENGFSIKFYNNISKFDGLNLQQKKIILFSKKVLNISRYKNLDIEFIVDKKNKIYLLQVRKLNIKKKVNIKIDALLENAKKKLEKVIFSKPLNLQGKINFLSTMPDWNPAEIIGLKPSNLSSSLYSEIITNEIWSKSRSFMGYKNIQNTRLMHLFLGTPYIDLKACLNSFIPSKTSEKTTKKIVNFYLRTFEKNPDYYFDKIENEIVLSCYNFSLRKKIKKQFRFLNSNEKKVFEKNIVEITNYALLNINKEIKKNRLIDGKLKKLYSAKNHPINNINELLKICKEFGTLPFANLARSAFIGLSFMNSMVSENLISQKEKNNFLNSISNVTTDIQKDIIGLNKNKFLEKYGHLRPNTYDIDIENYEEGFNRYFNENLNKNINIKKKFTLSKSSKTKLKKRISNSLLDKKINFKNIFLIIEKSIKFREEAKFNFSKLINKIFYEIKEFCLKIGINQNDLKHLSIHDFIKLYNNFNNKLVSKELEDIIKVNKKNFHLNKNIELPNTLTKPSDIYFKIEKNNQPTFIGSSKIDGNIIQLPSIRSILKNKIVMIENADPGFDFIFLNEIKGLITKFGGPNSHMSIRCNELGINAAIGVGDYVYNNILNKKNITLDTERKIIYGNY